MKLGKVSDYRCLFESGQYVQLKRIFDQGKYIEAQWNWIFAALCLLGHQEEALITHKLNRKDSFQLFFITIAYVRSGEYEKVRSLIKILRSFQKDQDRFFYYQALAFYAHFHCRYNTSLYFNNKSFQFSLKTNDPLWKTLAIDLLGHNNVYLGSIHRGTYYLEQAKDIAETLGNNSWVKATTVSLLNYSAKFTDNPKETISQIKKHLKSLKGVDNYSEGILLLALTHLEILIGDLNEGHANLIRAKEVIFKHNLHRQKAFWFFEEAYYLYIKGEFEKSLSSIEQALTLINLKVDLLIQLKLKGLKLQIYANLKIDTKKLQSDVENLTRLVGGSSAFNKIARITGTSYVESEDPLSEFYNSFYSSNWKRIIPQIVSMELWGLLRQKVTQQSGNYLITGIWKNGAILISPDNVFVVKEGFSRLLYQGFILLNETGAASKELIVRSLWGYEYDPYRHDPLIFSLIRRLKNLLIPLKAELKGEAHYYYLSKRYHLVELSLQNYEEKAELKKSLPLLKEQVNLNIRQHKAMAEMKKGKFFNVAEYSKVFSVTKMTALRDLAQLTELNLIDRFGKARATMYGVNV